MDLDIKFLPQVEYFFSELGETLILSLSLITYKHKVNILGVTVDLEGEKFKIAESISYIRRYIDPKTSANLNFRIGISDKSGTIGSLIQEFKAKILSESSKIILNNQISDEIKSNLYLLKDEYKDKILSQTKLISDNIRGRFKIDYDPIKGFFDKFNKESIFIEKSFVIPNRDSVELNVDNFLMNILSEIIFQPAKSESVYQHLTIQVTK